ncbi:hypothetical protein PtrM4_001630 [Pyrenophora tritici-repentis]|uniref:HTH CENPB-type domain-containing protein n=1 Tax=Pyrenophora tritici-repentis TaxID=45151 RepID=A0A834S4R2_9PLEO|nr:hypothetical protein PtrM4_001630 [Pyrenophora tritici-repentis]
MALRSAPQLASNEADIQLAISSINAHQINSASTAAAIYNVPRTTPRNRRAGIPARRDCQPNSRKLTQREEEVIISHILHLDLRGFGPTYVDVRDMADKLMAARGASLVGIHWPRNFVKRTDSLRTCFNRAYDRQRALCENPALIQRWFKLVEETKTELSICDEDTYNFDEAGFIMGKITTQLVITGLERRGRPKSIQLGNREWVTLIAAISAGGCCLSPLKRAYSREVESLMRNHINYITKLEFLPAFKAAFDRAFTPANICSAFRGAGLVPLQLEAVLSKVDVQLRTLTPPAAALPEAPWKGAEVIMLSAKLMRDRISSLEKANSAASARRQRSKRRIQKHGVLTKGAGEDILAQNEADQQIAHEER